MDDLQRATYRALIEKECDEMRMAAGIWDRTDIDRDEKIRLFSEAQVRIRDYEQDAQDDIDSVIRTPTE